MKAATLLLILEDVIESLKSDGVIGPDDEFVNLNAKGYAKLCGDIVAICVKHGVAVPDEIQRIVVALPLLLPLLGAK